MRVLNAVITLDDNMTDAPAIVIQGEVILALGAQESLK
jgi:predicted amidohydrolase YtcJ